MAFGKILEMNQLPMLLFMIVPTQFMHTLIGVLPVASVDTPVAFERTVVDLAQLFDQPHQPAFRIPTVHQHCTEGELFFANGVDQHLTHMVQLALAVPVRVVDALVNDPETVLFRVDVDAGHHADVLDDPLCVAAVLPPHQFDLKRVVVVQHRVVEHQVPVCRLRHLSAHVLPHHLCRYPLTVVDSGSPHRG